MLNISIERLNLIVALLGGGVRLAGADALEASQLGDVREDQRDAAMFK